VSGASVQVSAPHLAAGAASLIEKETFRLLHFFFHSMLDVGRSMFIFE
jgi:hypothetical protein